MLNQMEITAGLKS